MRDEFAARLLSLFRVTIIRIKVHSRTRNCDINGVFFLKCLDSELLSKSRKYNQELYLRSQRHQEKKEKIQRRNYKLSVIVEKRNKDVKNRHGELACLRRSHILELTSVIFPIGEVKNITR